MYIVDQTNGKSDRKTDKIEECSTGSTADGEIVIHIEHLKKSFGSKDVLKDITMDLKKGENVVVLGRSGQGKSVAIKCIVGLLTTG